MIDRRIALKHLGLLICQGGLAVGCRTARSQSPSESFPSSDSSKEFELRLGEDLDQLGKRSYSDQGIPVLLIGENLDPKSRTPRGRGFANGGESARMASDFRALVNAFRRIQPKSTGKEVPKLFEVLAQRDLDVAIRNQP